MTPSARRGARIEPAAAPATGKIPRLICLVDTNVILDVVLRREPWAADAARLLSAIERREARGLVAAHAVTTVYYVVERAQGRRAAVLAVGDLVEMCAVVPIGGAELQRALALGLNDFEDGVQAAAYLAAGADYIVTRNGRDFAGAPVGVRTPGSSSRCWATAPAATGAEQLFASAGLRPTARVHPRRAPILQSVASAAPDPVVSGPARTFARQLREA